VHFYIFAAKLVRASWWISRGKSAERGNGAQRVALAPELAWVDAASPEFLDLDRALDELGGIDPRKVHTVELRFFLGATSTETAELLNRSRSSVDRDVAFSISWLHNRLRVGHSSFIAFTWNLTCSTEGRV